MSLIRDPIHSFISLRKTARNTSPLSKCKRSTDSVTHYQLRFWNPTQDCPVPCDCKEKDGIAMSRRIILSSEDEDSVMSDVPAAITEKPKVEDMESNKEQITTKEETSKPIPESSTLG